MTNYERSGGKAGSEPRTSQKAALRRKQGEAIGQELRKQFDHLLAEPLPDHLIALLDELERREAEK